MMSVTGASGAIHTRLYFSTMPAGESAVFGGSVAPAPSAGT